MHLAVGLLLTYACRFALSQRFPAVEIEGGSVSGIFSQTWKGRTVYKFEGIPYASPPVGEFRFQVKRVKFYTHAVLL